MENMPAALLFPSDFLPSHRPPLCPPPILPNKKASVAGGAAYANRNPLFRSPGGDGDDNDTVYSHGSGSTGTPSIEPRMGHQSALSRSGGGVQPSSGGRRALTRSGVELRGAAAFGNTSGAADAARTRLLQKRLGGGEAAGIVSLGNANGAGRSGNGGRQKPRGHVHEADMDDGKGSDMSGMVYLDQPKRPGLRGGVGLGGHGKNISGSGSTVIAGSTSSIGISGSGGGCSGPAMKGQEPAVKTCGCVTTATFLKLVRSRFFCSWLTVFFGAPSFCVFQVLQIVTIRDTTRGRHISRSVHS